MTDGAVECRITDHVAHVRLARPAKHNALDRAMLHALVETGLALRVDRTVRAVVLSGEGPSFCSGLDRRRIQDLALGAPVDRTPVSAPIGAARALGQQAAHVWTTMPVPVIAALHGAVFGGGLQIALGADIRIVAPDARLSVMEIRWGLVPDMTGTQQLLELVRRDVAMELTLSGRIVTGAEATAMGIATRTEPDPLSAALQLAADFAERNPDAVRWAKRLVNSVGRHDVASQFRAEQDAMTALAGSPNQGEAVRAVLERRRPAFADPVDYDCPS